MRWRAWCSWAGGHQWLRDELKLINESADSEYFANKVKGQRRRVWCPRYHWLGRRTGICTPGRHPRADAGRRRNSIIRAALEGIAYQTLDVLKAMQADSGVQFKELGWTAALGK